MAFTYDLTTERGLVRFRIGDTQQDDGPRPDKRNFSDVEIDKALVEGGTVGGAVALLQSVLGNEWSTVPDERVGPRSQKFSQIAASYREASGDAGGVGNSITFTTKFVRKDGYSSDA